MSNPNRLPAPYGRWINREQTISFEFDGKSYQGLAGDTIASALIANQQWLMSRSFKYHRPRGPLTMSGHDANTLIQLPAQPNALADRVSIEPNLVAEAQNTVGSLQRDWMSVLGVFSRFLPVAFYYKAFYRPRGIWPLWAKIFRRQAGLGKIDESFSAEHANQIHDKQYKFADVAVIGGGPAGLSAALAAAEAGEKVILVDENPVLGGSLNYAPESEQARRDELVRAVLNHSNIEVLTDTVCNSWHADHWLALVRGKRLFKLRAKRVVLCTGSVEQPAIFRGNDIPGVITAGAALRLIHLYGVAPGQRGVILAGNDEAYKTATELLNAGIELAAVIDLRAQVPTSSDFDAVIEAGVEILAGHAIYQAHMDSRKKRVSVVEIKAFDGDGHCSGQARTVACDFVVMSVGFMPAWQLPCMAGGQLRYDDESSNFQLDSLPDGMRLAGSINGTWALEDVLRQGKAAGNNSAEETFSSPLLNHPWPMVSHPKGKEFVDLDEDLQIADIINATADGYRDIQLVKRYSTCGMGPSQGRHSALAAARLVAKANGKTVSETGVTTARPPVAAETLAVNAGRSFYPERKTNMHELHINAGAQMMQAGAWYRPAYYGSSLEMGGVIEAEVNNVRTNVGLIDVSTLGGLEVRGPQAAEFLNRFYTFRFDNLDVGKSRYALLCNEAGVVIDDGVAARFHEQHFYVTATTGGVDRVFQSMLKWNTQWGLHVDIANATSAWCGVNIAGPNSRAVLEAVCTDVDLSSEGFPYMAVREGHVADIPARLMRVGFVGELGFEIHVPQLYGATLWEALMQAGQEHGIKPFGVEAQRVLRLEKGHVIIGQDTDAMSNPMELQMTWALARKKPFFVGARTLRELDQQGLERVLVGFTMPLDSKAFPKESCLVLDGEKMVGRVTSCSISPTLGCAIGLAYVPPSMAEAGTDVTLKCEGNIRVTGTVCDLPFYDPKSERQVL